MSSDLLLLEQSKLTPRNVVGNWVMWSRDRQDRDREMGRQRDGR